MSQWRPSQRTYCNPRRESVHSWLCSSLVLNVLVQTHRVSFVSPLAKYAVSMVHGGIETHGPAYEVLKMTPEAASEMLSSQMEMLDQAESTKDPSFPESPAAKEGKLVIAEEVALGHVSRNACESQLALSFRKYLDQNTCLLRQAVAWQHGIERDTRGWILDSVSWCCWLGGDL